MMNIISDEIKPQLKTLLEIFRGNDEESMLLGIGIFAELFPKSSFFIYSYKGGDLSKPQFIGMYEIILFGRTGFVPKYTMEIILLNLLSMNRYYTYKNN